MITTKNKFRVFFVSIGLLFGLIGAVAPAAAVPTVTASNGGSYTLKNGVAITPITFTVTNLAAGQTLASFSAVTQLPGGLTLNTTNGTITGTPTLNQNAANYTIRATFAGTVETVDTVISITVVPGLNPQSRTVTYTAGTAITPTPAIAAEGFTGAVTYAVTTGTIPAGLTLNAANGSISGTPQIAQSATTITITGTGATAGTDTTTVTITINPAITPTTQTITGTVGTAITATTPFTPFGFTGLITYTISPALPAGLTLNASTGVISGTATIGQVATNHTITATDSLSRTATSTVSVTMATLISPTTRSVNVTQNQVMTPTAAYTLTGFGGTITYSVAPALPAGLTLNTATGVISGTPTTLQAATNYTITITGSAGGTGTTALTISVLAPLAAPTSVTATAGDASASVSWAAVAGATGYVVTAEPAAGSCVVTGTTANCTGLTNGTSYVFRVAATNAAGTASLSAVSAAVSPKPPFVTKSGKLTIFYSVTGTVVPAAGLTQLRAVGGQFKADKGTNAAISVKGFTTRAGTAIEKRLASSRATLVAQALRAAGLSGTYTTTGDGVTNRIGVKARKVVVKYTYQVPN